MPNQEPQSLLSYIRHQCGIPGEGAMQFGAEWKKLTDEDKADLLRWAHEQGDTHVFVKAS